MIQNFVRLRPLSHIKCHLFLLILELFDQIWYFFINHIYIYWCDEFENIINKNIWVNEGFSGAYICPGFFYENDRSFSWIVLGIKKLSFAKINTIQQIYNDRRVCFWLKTLNKKLQVFKKNNYIFFQLSEKTIYIFPLKHSKTFLSNCLFWHFSIKQKLLNFYGKISNLHILVPESHTLRWEIEMPWNEILIFLAFHIFW